MIRRTDPVIPNLSSDDEKESQIFGTFRKTPYLCKQKNNIRDYMCTVTLSYDQNNALARRKLAALLATGLFSQKTVDETEPTPELVEAHRKEREAFLDYSKKSMSHIIARYL